MLTIRLETPEDRVAIRQINQEAFGRKEEAEIVEKLREHNGNKTRVARELGLSRNGLMKKIQRYGL